MQKKFKRPAPRQMATFEPNMAPTELEHESEGRNPNYPVYQKVRSEEDWKSLIRVNLQSVSALQQQYPVEKILINDSGEVAEVEELCIINPEILFQSDNTGTLELAD